MSPFPPSAMRSEASQTMASTDGCVRGERVVRLQSKESEHIHLCDVAGVCLLGACFLCAQDRRSSGRHSGLPPDLVLALDLFSLSHSFSAFLKLKKSARRHSTAPCARRWTPLASNLKKPLMTPSKRFSSKATTFPVCKPTHPLQVADRS